MANNEENIEQLLSEPQRLQVNVSNQSGVSKSNDNNSVGHRLDINEASPLDQTSERDAMVNNKVEVSDSRTDENAIEDKSLICTDKILVNNDSSDNNVEDEKENFFEARANLDTDAATKVVTDKTVKSENDSADNFITVAGESDKVTSSTENTMTDRDDSSNNSEEFYTSENVNRGDIDRTVSNSIGENGENTHSGIRAGESDSSGTDGEYESADEGEEIQVDADQLKNLEESLTDEQKEERRCSAQILKEEGNELFRCGSYKSAIRLYSRALRTCPLKFAKDRAIMYSNRAVCKMKLYEEEAAIRDCTRALDLHPHYMKALMRRAELYEKTEKLDEALADYQKIIELDPSQHSARAACMRLPDQIKERNEKLKEEMMGKLKELGNLVLRPFGLSTNNFQLNQNPETGGYSVNFVQNPQE